MFDPMLGRDVGFATTSPDQARVRTRPGDRVLVHKWFYTLFDPKRFDVIVFKDPTDSSRNYIKRLVGLPGEEVWLADGDVFTRRADRPETGFMIRRKPLHVQRALWN